MRKNKTYERIKIRMHSTRKECNNIEPSEQQSFFKNLNYELKRFGKDLDDMRYYILGRVET